MKYLTLLTILLLSGCVKHTQVPECFSNSGTTYVLVTPISLPMIENYVIVPCLK